jgi:hypothetical protein
MERLIGKDIKIPYQQILKGHIVLKAGQVGYLMNHLGLGDNATFVAIKATYDLKCVNEEDHYIEYYYTDDTSTIRSMSQLMILTGNSTHRIPQLYFTNPNSTYKVHLDVMVAVVDDTYTFFPDATNQSGLSFYNLQCNSSIVNIQTFVVNESIVINDNGNPVSPLVYLVLNDISSISITGQIIVLDESTAGRVYLEFISIVDAKQAYSLIHYVMNNTGIIIQDLSPILDLTPPIVYFYEQIGNTSSGSYIAMSGITGSAYNTGTSSTNGLTFSTSISLSTYGTSSTITKSILSNIMINDCADNRDGMITLTDTNYLLYDYAFASVDSITSTGTYSMYFSITDIAGNVVAPSTDVILTITT